MAKPGPRYTMEPAVTANAASINGIDSLIGGAGTAEMRAAQRGTNNSPSDRIKDCGAA